MTAGVCIVGAGQAAAELARTLRQEGYEAPIRMFGREAIPPYDRPPLSKKFLATDLDVDRLLLQSRDSYVRNAIELVTGSTVAALDPVGKSVQLMNGEVFDFDKCVLATGAHARMPNIPGIDIRGVHALRTNEDARKLRTAMQAGNRLVILGAGYLGLEVASSARSVGLDVWVIEGAPKLMQRSLSPLMAAAIEERHRRTGTRFLFETSILNINGIGRVESVTTSAGDVIKADAVLIAIGAEPATELATLSGLDCNNGILVDAACRTSCADIYAIGDCANQFHPLYQRHLRLEAISSALFHARSAAADLLGKPPPPSRLPTFWSEQCEGMLQIIGVPHPGSACEDVRKGDDSGFAVYRYQDDTLVAVEAMNSPRDFVQARTLMGKPGIKPEIR